MTVFRHSLLGICLLALTVMASVAAGQVEPTVIEDVSVRVEGSTTVLSVGSSRKLDWNAIWRSEAILELTIPGSIVTNRVVDLAPDEGLIGAVRFFEPQIDGASATVIEVRFAEAVSYSSAGAENLMELAFRSRLESEAAEVEPEVPPIGGFDSALADPMNKAAAAAAPRVLESDPTDPRAREVTTPTPESAVELSGEYRIGPGDLLEVSVFGLDDFDRTVRVLRDGSISLPLLGTIGLHKMTLQEAEHTVATLLSERQLVNAPQVSIFVKDYVSRGVSVQGAVEQPGVYQMIQQRTLLEILGEAGGLSGRENDRAGQQIFVIRKMSDGGQERIEIDSDQLMNQGRADLNIPLFPGDVILVPFAQKHRVYVSGAVARPGPVEYLSSEGITVLQAITAAGGPTERGNLGNVKILRKLSDGSESRIEVNVKKIRKGKQEDVALERNDTVLVGEWFF